MLLVVFFFFFSNHFSHLEIKQYFVFYSVVCHSVPIYVEKNGTPVDSKNFAVRVELVLFNCLLRGHLFEVHHVLACV